MVDAPGADPPGPGRDGDDALLAAVAAGDRGAYARLMERHVDRCYALARRMTGDAAEAEDVVQEAFLRVWTRAADWRPGGAQFATWLYRVTLNLCLDRRRRAGRILAADPVLLEERPDPAPLADAALAAVQDQRRLQDAVADLPDRQRAAVLLTYMEELSNAEVADALDISVGAVESLLVRARRALRGMLAEPQAATARRDAT